MTVLERSELEASTLADLHTIANQVGIDGYRRLRKAQLIDAILRGEASGTAEEAPAAESREGPRETAAAGEPGQEPDEEPGQEPDEEPGQEPDEEDGEDAAGAPSRRRRFGRLRRGAAGRESDVEAGPEREAVAEAEAQAEAEGAEAQAGGEPVAQAEAQAEAEGAEEPEVEAAPRRGRGRARAEERGEAEREVPKEEVVEGIVELLSNGSAFMRVDPPGSSERDVYVSAAQVRRCELVAGDRVAGPIRLPRRSERYPSLVRVQTINGAPASEIAEGPRYEDLTALFPDQRLRLDSEDVNLRAIDWLTPIGLGSRAVIVGPSRAGKTETLRRLVGTLAGREGLEVSVVLVGIRPEEAGGWREGPVEPAAALSFAAGQEVQGQALERAIETAKRVAARGGDALVAIDTLDAVTPALARRALSAARNLAEAGSLTVIATASEPLGGETTVIALDLTLTATGRLPSLELARSGTLRPELLVGEDGARAITEARASALPPVAGR